MNGDPSSCGAGERIDQASEWFALMRGPEAESSRVVFERWIADPENARAYAEVQAIWSLAGAARPDQPLVQPRAPAVREHRDTSARSWRRPALAAAAIVLVVAALALILSGFGRPAVPRKPLVAYASNIGQIRTIVLADGSHVTLDTASRVMPSFSDRERRISLLAGRARFTVAHEPGRPFIVVAGAQSVIARGTVFDVRLDGEDLEVVLLEGKVEIEGAGSDASGAPPVSLAPGKRAIIVGAEKDLRIDVAPRLAAGWPEGMISAEGMPLTDLIREANRYSTSPVVLTETGLGSLRVTGAFKPGNAQALGAALAEALNLSAVTQADGAVLLARPPA